MNTSCICFLIFTVLIVNSLGRQQSTSKLRPSQTQKATSSATTNKQWYLFNAPDKDFVIEFPTRPRREADTEAPSGTRRNYALDMASMSLLLSYVDSGLEPDSRDGNQLPLAFRQLMLDQARERGWTVLRSQLLHKNVYEQETWSPMKSNPNLRLHYVERHIVRYGRQYALTCSSLIPEQKVKVELCQRFFNSFRVIREPQPQ
jgi:hypothetical protein